MILEIVHYGHPVLREKGRRIERITPELRQLAADMIETMYAANGVGLAAQQVGHAVLLAVIDVSGCQVPWSMSPTRAMPLVLVNPVLTRLEGAEVSSEGCLSVPDIRAEIRRAGKLTVEAQDLDGNPIDFECTGELAFAAQHEVDHLNGVLFVDRMDAATRASFAGKLKKMQKTTQDALKESAEYRLPQRRSSARKT